MGARPSVNAIIDLMTKRVNMETYVVVNEARIITRKLLDGKVSNDSGKVADSSLTSIKRIDL